MPKRCCEMLDDQRGVPHAHAPYSIHGDLPLGPLLGSLATTKSKGMSAMRSQVASLRGNGAAVAKGTPHPVPKAKRRILSELGLPWCGSPLVSR